MESCPPSRGIRKRAKLDLVRAVIDAYRVDAFKMPASRSLGRVGDMAPREKTHMRVMLDAEGDVCVEIWDDARGRSQRAGIEFCMVMGGGKSPHTREALLGVMRAMELDNEETPHGAFPPPAEGA